jgi:hypothetical protein
VNFGILYGISYGDLLHCDSAAVVIYGCRLDPYFNCEDEGSMYKDWNPLNRRVGIAQAV